MSYAKIPKMGRWRKGSTQGKGGHQAHKCPAQKAIDKIEEMHHVVLFLYKADKTNYGRLIEQMLNDVLQRKDPFTVADVCRILSGWKKQYGNRDQQQRPMMA